MIVTEVQFEDRVIELSGNIVNKENNVFTLVVGRNGYGKSSLLQKICLINIASFLNQSDSHIRIQDIVDYYENRDLAAFDETGSIFFTDESDSKRISIEKPSFIPPNINLNTIPEHLHEQIINNLRMQYLGNSQNNVRYMVNGSYQENIDGYPKVIAVSSSPFDKFPLLDNHRMQGLFCDLKNHYIYRGAKTKDKSSKSYMRSKFDQLGASFVDFFLKPANRINEILPLFKYLKIDTKFTVYLTFPDHFSLNDILDESRKGPLEAIRTVRFFKGKEHDDSLTNEDKEKIIKSVKSLHEGLLPGHDKNNFHRREEVYTLNLDINSSEQPPFLEEFSVLADYDLVDLANIEFVKTTDNKNFFLTEASSGELCILFNILAIAGTITDGSIVLLDEPELSLHPEWQRDFLPLLAEVFSKYKKCHFIVATHSPHIVSSLPASNSFVVNLENNPAKVVIGESLALQSSDFQLAYTFKSPGYKNEYLISQLVEVLSQLSEGKALDRGLTKRINDLVEFDSIISADDPVKKLLSTLKKALEVLSNE